MPLQVSLDLHDEIAEFHDFLSTLAPEDWERETLFMNWTPWDVLAHLHYFDRVSLDATEGHEIFRERQAALLSKIGSGTKSTELQREALGDLGPDVLLDRWRKTGFALCERLGSMNPKQRLPWFGPDMGVQMFTTARFMETWAHAQEVYDLKGVRRVHSDRIRNIVAIGVRTYGWTFVNRGLEVPEPMPFVLLEAPSGDPWEYGEPSDSHRVEGSAVEFCQVVTQVRNVRDTSLDVRGESAIRWMEIAQCFAGPPADPPAPGLRLDP